MDSRPSNSGKVGCLLLEGAARTGTPALERSEGARRARTKN